MRFDHVTTMRAEGKQTHVLCKLNTFLTYELRRQQTIQYCRREIMFITWTVHACFPAAPFSSDHLAFTFNEHGMHRFDQTTVLTVNKQ